jgi:hypothetical protein
MVAAEPQQNQRSRRSVLEHHNATTIEHLDASLLSLLMLTQKGYRGRRRALMPKRRRSPAAAKPASRWTRPDIKHTSVYLPEAAYEALRQVAFEERRKIHDLLMEGVELALKKRGYPAIAEMKSKSKGR